MLPAKSLRLSAVAFVLLAGVAQADGWHDFWRRMKVDFHRNDKWPYTFIYADRAAAQAPFMVMTQNGWRSQNTLGNYYFEVGSAELNEAGRLKVDLILTQAPPQFHMVYVERAENQALTTARMATIRKYAAASPDGTEIAVFETAIPARGWPAEEIYNTYVKYTESRPTPALPSSTGGSGGGGGGSSGSR